MHGGESVEEMRPSGKKTNSAEYKKEKNVTRKRNFIFRFLLLRNDGKRVSSLE